MRLLELPNQQFPWWVTWIEVEHNNERGATYRAYWSDYLERKHEIYAKMKDWLWSIEWNSTKAIKVLPLHGCSGVGFETEGEAMQFLLTFSEQISLMETNNG